MLVQMSLGLGRKSTNESMCLERHWGAGSMGVSPGLAIVVVFIH